MEDTATVEALSAEELRSLLLSEPDVIVRPVPTPEWPRVNGHIYVRNLNVEERDKYLESIRTVTRKEDGSATVHVESEMAQVKLAVAAMCDKNGTRLFTEADVLALQKKDGACMQRVIDEASMLNGMSARARQDAKNVSTSVVTSD